MKWQTLFGILLRVWNKGLEYGIIYLTKRPTYVTTESIIKRFEVERCIQFLADMRVEIVRTFSNDTAHSRERRTPCAMGVSWCSEDCGLFLRSYFFL